MNVRVTGIRIVAALAAVALLQSAAPAQPSATASAPAAAGTPDATFTTIAHAYFYDGFRESPSGATSTGVHAYDASLDDVPSLPTRDISPAMPESYNSCARSTARNFLRASHSTAR
jgi:hypothetical protein